MYVEMEARKLFSCMKQMCGFSHFPLAFFFGVEPEALLPRNPSHPYGDIIEHICRRIQRAC